MRIVTKAMAAVSLAALLLSATAALGEPRVGSHSGGWHGHARHTGGWRGGARSIGPGVAGGSFSAPTPAFNPPPPPPSGGGCLPTSPRYDSYGAYVANGC